MKPETAQQLRFSTASLMRALFASSWLWERLPEDFVRKNRARLQRAARKAQGDPLGFAEKYLGVDWFTADPKLPERAAAALSEILYHLLKADFVLSEVNERWLLRLVLVFLSSLAARPGRPRLEKYRAAAALSVVNGKLSNHKLCVRFEPGYHSMNRDEQRRAR